MFRGGWISCRIFASISSIFASISSSFAFIIILLIWRFTGEEGFTAGEEGAAACEGG